MVLRPSYTLESTRELEGGIFVCLLLRYCCQGPTPTDSEGIGLEWGPAIGIFFKKTSQVILLYIKSGELSLAKD